jgi:adenosylcobyric acid synthase
MGLARHGRIPTVVVGDIDRGGVFAALYGTLKLMPARDQELVRGFVLNKFRGDRALLEPGLRMIEEATERPVLGVVPWLPGLWLDSEDSLDLAGPRAEQGAAGTPLRVVVVRFPRISNFTDVDALGIEPNVDVRFTDRPDPVRDADLVVLPGTRATLADLGWLRERGLEEPLAERHRAGRPVLAICGGFQMLGGLVADPHRVESTRGGSATGVGLLPVRTAFRREKVLGRPRAESLGHDVRGYEIHHGAVDVHGGEAFPGGCRDGATWGTLWHGMLENDGFRRAFLGEVSAAADRADWAPCPDTVFAARRKQRLDLLGDAVERHLDTARLLEILSR